MNNYQELDEMIVEVENWWDDFMIEFETAMQGDRVSYMQPPQQEVIDASPVSNGAASPATSI